MAGKTTNFHVDIKREVRVGLSDKSIAAVLNLAFKRAKGRVKQASVAFVSEAVIRRINKKYRKIDKVTDVLSFCYDEDVEIMVSPTKTWKVWEEAGKGKREALAFVLVHGYLHAVGMDHETLKTREKMLNINDAIVKEAKTKGYV